MPTARRELGPVFSATVRGPTGLPLVIKSVPIALDRPPLMTPGRRYAFGHRIAKWEGECIFRADHQVVDQPGRPELNGQGHERGVSNPIDGLKSLHTHDGGII